MLYVLITMFVPWYLVKYMCILLYVIYTSVNLSKGPSKTITTKKTDAERPFKGLLE